jgi:iron complex outermembrane receptor protein
MDAGASWYIPLPDGQANNTSIPIQHDFLGTSPRKAKDGSIKIDYAFEPFTLTSVSAYTQTKIDLIEDLDWTPASILGAQQLRGYESFSQEIRLSSPSSQDFRWTAGAYLLDAKKSIDTIILISPNPVASGLAPSAYIPFPIARADEDILTKAAYAQVNYSATDQFELTAALRYDNDARTQSNRLVPGPEREAKFNEWQPKLSNTVFLPIPWCTPQQRVVSEAAGSIHRPASSRRFIVRKLPILWKSGQRTVWPTGSSRSTRPRST